MEILFVGAGFATDRFLASDPGVPLITNLAKAEEEIKQETKGEVKENKALRCHITSRNRHFSSLSISCFIVTYSRALCTDSWNHQYILQLVYTPSLVSSVGLRKLKEISVGLPLCGIGVCAEDG